MFVTGPTLCNTLARDDQELARSRLPPMASSGYGPERVTVSRPDDRKLILNYEGGATASGHAAVSKATRPMSTGEESAAGPAIEDDEGKERWRRCASASRCRSIDSSRYRFYPGRRSIANLRGAQTASRALPTAIRSGFVGLECSRVSVHVHRRDQSAACYRDRQNARRPSRRIEPGARSPGERQPSSLTRRGVKSSPRSNRGTLCSVWQNVSIMIWEEHNKGRLVRIKHVTKS